MSDNFADAGDALRNLPGDQLSGNDGTLENTGEVSSGADAPLNEVARKLTGRENALFRQISNAERKLAKRMETVERMRLAGEQTGDVAMIESADQFEAWAMNHFDQRMAQISEFQQRHDLPEVSQFFSR